MKKFNDSFLASALIASALLTAISAQAQGLLKITEVESDEAGGKINNNSKPDWFELSNFGNVAISLTGYKMDDDSASFASAVSLTGISSIAPGESVVFFEGPTFTLQNFSDWWGSSLGSTQVGTYTGSGVSLGKTGDQVNIFDSTGTLVDGVVLTGTAITGSSFYFDAGAIGRAQSGVSQSGVDGAFTSNFSDIGSPGVVPEPSTLALAGVSVAALAGFRRWKNRQA
jgi:hypothetical protein